MQAPIILTAFGDNYIYLLAYAPGKALAVDPGDASVVVAAAAAQGLAVTHILATHHHADHIGGIDALCRQFGCDVVSSDKKRIPATGTVVRDGDHRRIGPLDVKVLATPGHTATSVCFFVTADALAQPLLFSGDTLFVGGCGRLFEGDGQTLFASFQKLRALPGQTGLYPGHNYTEENLRFAFTVEPDNTAVKQGLADAVADQRHGRPTVPSTLEREKAINLFLRADTGQALAALRQKKDHF